MKCPRCQNVLAKLQFEGVETDSCASCGGTWLDYGEIRQILDSRAARFTPQQVALQMKKVSTEISDREKTSVEKCPKCSKSMAPMNFNYGSGVITDVCLEGHGMWFDKSELESVQIHFESADSDVQRRKPELQEALRRIESSERKPVWTKPRGKSAYLVDVVMAVLEGLED